MDLIAIEQARRLVQERFPDALSAILAGSTVTDSATTTSDLDIAVLLGDHGVSQRDTTRFEGRLAELFVHTRQGLSEVFAADVASRRAVLQTMYATGVILFDTDGEAKRAQRAAVDTLCRDGTGWNASWL